MFEQNLITIAPSANGFVVTLPYIESPLEGRASEFKEMMHATKDLLKGLHEDPLLAKQEDTEEEFNRLADMAMKVKQLKDIKNTRVYVFKTFPEVLEFLDGEMKR